MTDEQDQLETVVFFLSDHLCSAIEASDYLLAHEYSSEVVDAQEESDEILERLEKFHKFLDDIRTYEFLIVTKINQVRHWSLHLRQLDKDFRPVIDLFNASTMMVSDAVDLLGQDENDIFNGNSEPQRYLESRNIRIEQEQPNSGKKFSIDESFLIGGKVELRDLLDVCISFHQSVERQYAEIPVEPDDGTYDVPGDGEGLTEGQEPFSSAH